jgi:uncharacterized repeat protein (TIGR03803 family)
MNCCKNVSALLLSGALLAACDSGTGTFMSPLAAGSDTQHVTTSYHVLLRFPNSGKEGASPQAGLISANGLFFGTTYRGGNSGCYANLGCGTVFQLDASGKETVLYRFKGGSDGANPIAGLVNVKGVLYGATQLGGANGDGTIFKVNVSGNESVVYSFKGGSDGANPFASLIAVGGALYGTTWDGGSGSNCGASDGCGTIFKVTTSGSESVLHSFQGGNDGANPWGALLYVSPTFYGTTSIDGSSGDGTVFIMSKSGKERVLYAFKGGPDGANPWAGLVALNGALYGTTFYGGTGSGCGSSTCGTVFQVTTSGAESVVYSFKGGTSDGANPWAPLTVMNGQLYGPTSSGGAANVGTIFQLSPSGGESVLYSFKNARDGAHPIAGLLPVGSTLYGTTFGGGGASGAGTVFTLSP